MCLWESVLDPLTEPSSWSQPSLRDAHYDSGWSVTVPLTYNDLKGCPSTSLCFRRPQMTDVPLYHLGSFWRSFFFSVSETGTSLSLHVWMFHKWHVYLKEWLPEAGRSEDPLMWSKVADSGGYQTKNETLRRLPPKVMWGYPTLWVIHDIQIAVVSQMKLRVNFLDELKKNNCHTPSVDYFKCFQFN
jgi:hypothetical protein